MELAEIIEAKSTADYAAARTLIEEYAAALGVDLGFQNFAEEIETLPALYGPPRGCLLLARSQGDLAGCIALRDHGANTCEMKRLYVRPQHRATGLGRRLVESAVAHAQRLAYTRMVLDTLPDMTAAQGLYASLGFREIGAYYPNPLAGARFLARELPGKE